MNVSTLFSAKLLVPLTLLTPYVFVLHYGISILELLVFAFLLLLVLSVEAIRFPKFLLVFYVLFTLGYFGALINGLQWNVPIGIWNLNFFYKMLVGIGAFFVGVKYRNDLISIFSSHTFLIAVLVLASIALVYPFLSFETKINYLGVFYPPDSGFERYFTSRRMPGLGLNANIYAFIVFSYLLFSFRAFLNKHISLIRPLLLFLVILVLSSKVMIALSVAACTFMLFQKTLHMYLSRLTGALQIGIHRRGFVITSSIVVILLCAGIIATQTSAGRAVVDSYATVARFQRLLSAAESPDGEPRGFARRIVLWKKGLDRVQMAPLLGIAKDPFKRLSDSLVGFYNPHNEFLRMWALYGFAGLCAWIFLLSYMLYKNMRRNTGVEWVILYVALAFFMMFDGGLDDPRVTVYLLLVLGLNWAELTRKAGDVEPAKTSLGEHTRPVLT